MGRRVCSEVMWKCLQHFLCTRTPFNLVRILPGCRIFQRDGFTQNHFQPSFPWPAQGRCYTEVLILEVSLSPHSFQGCRLMIGCRGSEGIGGGVPTRFLTGLLCWTV
jgi:hypothetical protein